MSTKRTSYSSEFKVKVVLELLANELTLAELASKHNITTKNIQNWKKIFLDNAVIAMEPAKAVKEYKSENDKLQHEVDKYAKKVGQLTIERDWLEGKLASLDLSTKKSMVESKLENISIVKQCQLLGINRGNCYYTPKINKEALKIKAHIQKIHEEIPIYGALKVHQQLLEDGFSVSVNTVQKYRQEMGLKAVLAVRFPNLSEPCKQHVKYTYKLRGINICRVNQVWSTDITYVKLKGGMVYLAAIIDWYSKAVLSWRISNTMDSSLVMSVLHEALDRFGNPEIFNTDQGSQYTSHIHTEALSSRGITISMDGKGRATDNICIERFWRSAKCERIYLNEYGSLPELRSDLADYIDFYNHRRFHESLGYKKPMHVYKEGVINFKSQAQKTLQVA
ncbi:IS3 family transposase [Cysteiniphilum sp. QT6929]|uniref:IS3 family transposase n=1 Tax=Cysteiniphilum sp. QT6929 TaxID=2975055 RepID=UPI0024B3476F|nr:IS3 family transposase [Cysteiniphilum sp. QT6929]WHN65016.1 IS3 family transposase [Cysteiniphilum sp. QT6929]WHN65052.1 IS3 family transposase [Cysteiniphilum sp. QT6929]WHN65234.1 IS3 family transposase [Cysteiniphilum sp. QT6929]